MAAGFLLIIYLKAAPIDGPLGLARCRFLDDGIAKFKNFPIKPAAAQFFAPRGSRCPQVRDSCLTLLDTLKVVHIWYTTKTYVAGIGSNSFVRSLPMGVCGVDHSRALLDRRDLRALLSVNARDHGEQLYGRE